MLIILPFFQQILVHVREHAVCCSLIIRSVPSSRIFLLVRVFICKCDNSVAYVHFGKLQVGLMNL